MTNPALRSTCSIPRPGRGRARAAGRILFAALAAASCGGRDMQPVGNDLDGIPRLALEEDRRIGSVDDPDYGFSGIGGVDEDRDGNVYVFEQTDVQIRVYAPDGRLVRRIGREGEGPGEFRGWAHFGVVGDTLWAIESSSRRISLFRRDGTVLSTAPIQNVSVPIQRYIGIILPVSMGADGLFTSDLGIYASTRGVELDVGAEDTVLLPRVRFDATGAVVDTVGWMPRPPQHWSTGEQLEMGGNRYRVPTPPLADALLQALPDGHLVIERPYATSSESGTLVVTRFGLSGDTVYSRVWQYRPDPYDDGALDALAWRTARVPGGGIPVINGVPTPPPVPDDSMAVFHELRSRMHFPPFQMAVSGLRLGADGTIWLRRADDGGASWSYSILDLESGRFVGQVSGPRTANPVWLTSDAIWAMEQDELDVPWLVHYRLVAG